MPFPTITMKKFICILASAALLAACEQKTETTEPAAASPTATATAEAPTTTTSPAETTTTTTSPAETSSPSPTP